MKCLKGAVKHRHSHGGGHPGNYKRSLRGHSWQKQKDGRIICKNCGKVQ